MGKLKRRIIDSLWDFMLASIWLKLGGFLIASLFAGYGIVQNWPQGVLIVLLMVAVVLGTVGVVSFVRKNPDGLSRDDTEHDTIGTDAMSRLLNETLLKNRVPTVTPDELALELLQAGIEGRIRIWMRREKGQPYYWLKKDDLQYARRRKVEWSTSAGERKELEAELDFSISIYLGPRLGTWRDPRFSSKDLTKWFARLNANAVGNEHSNSITGSENQS